jgi:hypothetical protein
MKDISHYTILIPHTTISSFSWIEYRGDDVGYDWWNSSPKVFTSEEEALKTIANSNYLKQSKWKLVKTTIKSEIIR